MSDYNPYAETSEINRPLAMKAHLDTVMARALRMLDANDVDAAIRELYDGLGRYERLGGADVMAKVPLFTHSPRHVRGTRSL